MKKNSFGFTLIELLIAITIGMLLVGFGTISLNNFYEKQKVESTTEELLANLRLARNYAVTNQFKNGGDRLLVTIDANGLMEMKSYKKDGTYIETVFSKNIVQKDVSIDITDADGKDDKGNPVGAEIIKFSVTDGRSINGLIDISISINGGVNLTKNITIDESGLIYEK